MKNKEKRVLLASPRGFCVGVKRAINILEDIIKQEKNTVYVRKEIVHNTTVVSHFESLGVVFVDEIDQIPNDSVVVFSAHGVAPSVREKAIIKNLKVVDATCPLVTKVHEEAIRFKEQGSTIILIGHIDHDEMTGIIAEAPNHIQVIKDEADFKNLAGIENTRIAWLSQTTLNFDDTQQIVEKLRERYPLLQDPPHSDICFATRNRQHAVRRIAKECDLFIVVGSENSSNTNRLAEVALESGAAKVLRVDKPEELEDVDFSAIYIIGVSSGASVPNNQLMDIVVHLKRIGYNRIDEIVSADEINSK